MLLFLVNVGASLRRGARAPANPWGAATLEWATRSPPPATTSPPSRRAPARPAVGGSTSPSAVVDGPCAATCREVLVTSLLDAEPDHAWRFPTPSIWPFSRAMATTVLVRRLDLHALGGGVGRRAGRHRADRWFWPTAPEAARSYHRREAHPRPIARVVATARGAARRRCMTARSTIDVSAAAELRASATQPDVVGHAGHDGDRRHRLRARRSSTYFYLRAQGEAWPPSARRRRTCCWGTVNTVDPARERHPEPLAKRAAEREDLRGVRLWLVVVPRVRRGLPRRARASSSRAERRWDSERLRLDRLGCCSACTPPTWSPTSSTRVLDGADVHRAARRQALRRCQRERVLLVLRGRRLDSRSTSPSTSYRDSSMTRAYRSPAPSCCPGSPCCWRRSPGR